MRFSDTSGLADMSWASKIDRVVGTSDNPVIHMKILLNILTHGDEHIGCKVAKEIQKLDLPNEVLTINSANEEAYKKNLRYIDQDLNRSFPGKEHGNHEERLAYRLSCLIQEFDIVLDIHSTKSNLKDTLIVTKLDKPTRRIIDVVRPRYVLVMRVGKGTGLISQARVGIAFEYGKDNDSNVLKKIVTDITHLLRSVRMVPGHPRKRTRTTQFFSVTKQVSKEEGDKLSKHIKNYKKVKKGEVFAYRGGVPIRAKEEFYPILFGETNYETIFGFMGKKMN